MPGQYPSLTSASLWQIPHASTLMRTCPRPGCGIGRSTISKLPPGLLTCTAFMRIPFCEDGMKFVTRYCGDVLVGENLRSSRRTESRQEGAWRGCNKIGGTGIYPV